LESSVNNLMKLLKKKREEINKQVQRLQSITSSALPALPAAATISSTLPTTNVSISHSPIRTTVP
ncbi:unnamed protein product, partial [Rotaria magnacalcarata]